MPGQPRVHAGRRGRQHPQTGQAQPGVGACVDQRDRGRTVVDAARVAGGDRAARAERGTQPAEPGGAQPVAGTLVAARPRPPGRPRRRSPRSPGSARRGRASGRRTRPAGRGRCRAPRRAGRRPAPCRGRRARPARTVRARSARAPGRRRAARAATGRSRPTRRRRRGPGRGAGSMLTATSIAASPLPHCRSTVSAGTSTGSPAVSAATRATSPPGPMQLPSTTSRGSRSGSAAARAARTGAARSAAVTSAKALPAVPMAVRSAPTITGASSRGSSWGLLISRTTLERTGRSARAGHVSRRGGSSPSSRRTRASRSTLPAVVSGGCSHRCQSRGRPRGRAAPATRRPGAVVGGVGEDSGDHRAEPGVRHGDHDDLAAGHRPERPLHVGHLHGGATGGHRLGPAVDGEPVPDEPAAVSDGGVAGGVPAQRAGRAVVPPCRRRATAPRSRRRGPRPRRRGTGAGRRRAGPTRRTRAPPRRSSGARRARRGRPARAARGRAGRRPPPRSGRPGRPR